jgi:hypothetical protein
MIGLVNSRIGKAACIVSLHLLTFSTEKARDCGNHSYQLIKREKGKEKARQYWYHVAKQPLRAKTRSLLRDDADLGFHQPAAIRVAGFFLIFPSLLYLRDLPKR